MSKLKKKKSELKRLQKERRAKKLNTYRGIINRKYIILPDPGFTPPPLIEYEEDDVEYIIAFQKRIQDFQRSIIFRKFT